MSASIKKKKVGFTAESFGFGPIAVTLNILKFIKKKTNLSSQYHFVLFGDHVSKQLAEHEGIFDEIIDCDCSTAIDIARHRDELRNFALFVCNTCPGPLSVLVNAGIPVVYVDLLFWMWNALDPNFKKVDRFIIEDFVDPSEQKKRVDCKGIPFFQVSPLIESCNLLSKEDPSSSFVSFGGIDNVFADTPPLVDSLLSFILPELTSTFSTVVVAGGGRTIELMKKKYGEAYPNVEFGYFDRETFRNQLAKSKKCIINPGLITFYECFDLNKDIFFLPAFNYSQHLQFQYIKKKFPNIPGWNYSMSEDFEKIQHYLPEKEGLKRIRNAVDQFVRCEKSQNDWKRHFAAFLAHSKSSWKDPEHKMPSGIADVVHIIKEYL